MISLVYILGAFVVPLTIILYILARYESFFEPRVPAPAAGGATSEQRSPGVERPLGAKARTEAIAAGRELLEKELHRLGFDQRNFDEIAKFFNYKNADEFLEALGHEDISIQPVSVKLLEAERAKSAPEAEAPAPTPTLPKAPETTITIKGVGGVVRRLARCCNPLPGDDVVGFITQERGITVHRSDCRNILDMDVEKERLIAIDWKQAEQTVYPVLVQVKAFDRSGLVHDISDIVAAEKVNMTSANAVVGRKDRIAVITATLEIPSADQLTRILNKIDRLPNVIEAQRVTSYMRIGHNSPKEEVFRQAGVPAQK